MDVYLEKVNGPLGNERVSLVSGGDQAPIAGDG